tara:strand:- start:2685 stop:3602 length:918 start_codon:yes stop_codon:yes gene_type:complete
MAEEEEVAPQTAEEDGLVTLADIAEASGIESFIESASETEAETEVEELAEEEIEEEVVPEIEPEPEPSVDSEGVKKRIGKLVEARKAAEEERDALKAQLDEAKDSRKSYANEGMDRFEGVRTFDEIDKREEDAEHLRDWLIENPDGGEYTDLAGGEHDVEYDQARSLMAQTDKDLRKNIPAVRQRLNMRGQNESLAMKTFPWLKNRESSEHQQMVQLLNENKDLGEYFKKDPAAMLTMGFLMSGLRNQTGKAQPKPATAPKVPSAPSRATTKVVNKKVGNDRKALLEQARSGEVEDAASYIETLL